MMIKNKKKFQGKKIIVKPYFEGKVGIDEILESVILQMIKNQKNKS